MCPAPAKTSYSEIIRTAQHLLETQGLENLSMQMVAASLGIRAPSLYKHVENKSQLVKAVLEAMLVELGQALADAVQRQNLKDDLQAIMIAYRAFAHEHSTLYPLLYSRLSSEMQPDIKVSATAVAPLLQTIEQWVNPEQSLSAARIVVAFTHGFVHMELAGAFRLGGNVEEAFELGIESLIEILHKFHSDKT
ncbi:MULTISPECIES: TetR/AcrR family transcriptional regulator [Nostocales]|uniref:TetR/AcrR family transcriptional regulator n=3 Tax=Nostocales TaxID=1161 RepID=A0A0C1NFM2_9CYAN|nr:TetR/AcrR family transcriptional regulator [Tolypothrix bouteillei]KAF3884345.1 TetR/AcrR family transcriptional regulator [Tolypothrix bouteillei VB521301]